MTNNMAAITPNLKNGTIPFAFGARKHRKPLVDSP